jgi:hypothetical protein
MNVDYGSLISEVGKLISERGGIAKGIAIKERKGGKAK